MAAIARSRQHEDQVDAAFKALKRTYPNLQMLVGRDELKRIAQVAIDASEVCPNPQRDYTVAVALAARTYVQSLERSPADSAIAQRYLQDTVWGSPGDHEIRSWDLLSDGEVIGKFQGTKREYERLQSGLV